MHEERAHAAAVAGLEQQEGAQAQLTLAVQRRVAVLSNDHAVGAVLVLCTVAWQMASSAQPWPRTWPQEWPAAGQLPG